MIRSVSIRVPTVIAVSTSKYVQLPAAGRSSTGRGTLFAGDFPDLLEKALEHEPKNRSIRLQLADTLNEMGEFEKAEAHYRKLLESLPEKEEMEKRGIAEPDTGNP